MPTLTLRQRRAAASKRAKWKIVLALFAALLLHLLLLPVVVWVASHWPRTPIHGHPLGPLRVTFLPSASPTPTPSPGEVTGSPQAPYMKTNDDQETTEKIDDPKFFSDKNTREAAELAAKGEKPLPTQEGKELPNFDFVDRRYRPGDTASQGASAPPAQANPGQSKVDGKTETQAQATPKPENQPKAKKAASQATPDPKGELAMAAVDPTVNPATPAPTPEKPTDQDGNTPPQPARQLPANPETPSRVASTGLPKKPGYQEQTRQSKMEGSINNRGKPAVQALGTPLGKYIKTVEDSIGMLWYYRVEEKMDVLGTGDVKLHFFVARDGKATQVRVSKGNPNSALASISTGAIMDADIPPIPPDVAATLPAGQLEADLEFNMY